MKTLNTPEILENNGIMLVKKIGAGGMGIVFEGLNKKSMQRVAIKQISMPPDAEDILKRVKREYSILKNIQHNGVVRVHDLFFDQFSCYLIMELLAGESLANFRRRAHPSTEKYQILLKIFLKVTEALAHVHSLGIIHRDIKPHNILLEFDQNQGKEPARVVLTDFGMAGFMDAHLSLTKSGSILGTVSYISPEQVKGLRVEERADLYSLGVTIYECVTGRLPFEGENPVSILFQHIHDAPAPPGTLVADLPLRLEQLILKLLNKEPGQRFQTAGTLHQEILEILARFETLKAGKPHIEKSERKISILPHIEFTGREEELGILQRKLNLCNRGKGQTVLIKGIKGIGKSRLLREFKKLAVLSCAECIQAECHEEDIIPLSPVPGILKKLKATRNEPQNPELDKLLKMITIPSAELLRNIESGSKFSGDGTREQEELLGIETMFQLSSSWKKNIEDFFPNFCLVLKKKSEKIPLILILDNMEMADSGVMDLILYLTHAIREDRIFILMSASLNEAGTRDQESGDRGEILDTFNTLRQFPDSLTKRFCIESNFTEIILKSLNFGQTKKLVNSLLASPQISDDFLEKIYQCTKGVPLYLRELIALLIEEGKLLRKHGIWTDIEKLHADQDYTLEPEEIPIRRVKGLNPGARELLITCAILGYRFSFDHIKEIMVRAGAKQALDAEAIRSVIEEIQLTQLITKDRGSQENFYRFSHEWAREIIYKWCSQSKRKHIHKITAQVLEESSGECVEKIARHFVLAGIKDRAVKYLQLSALWAEKLGSAESAIEYFSKAIHMFQKFSPGDEDKKRLMLILQQRGSLFRIRGNLEGSLKDYKESLRLSMETGSRQTEANSLLHYGLVLLELGDKVPALKSFRKALKIYHELKDTCGQGDSFNNMGLLWESFGNFARAKKCYELAEILYREMNDSFRESVVLNNKGLLCKFTHEYEESEKALKRSMVLKKKTGDRLGQGHIVNNLGIIHYEKGKLTKAWKCFNKYLEIIFESGNRTDEAKALANLGEIDLLMGKLEKSLEEFKKAAEIAGLLGNIELESIVRTWIARVYLRKGDFYGAFNELEQVFSDFGANDVSPVYIEARIMLAELYMRIGLVDRTASILVEIETASHGRQQLPETAKDQFYEIWGKLNYGDEEALAWWKKKEHRFKVLGGIFHVQALLNRAFIYHLRKQWEQVEHYALKVQTLARSMELKWEHDNACLLLCDAMFNEDMDNFPKSDTFQNLTGTLIQSPYPELALMGYEWRGESSYILKNFREAEVDFKKAREISQKLRESINEFENPEIYQNSEYNKKIEDRLKEID